MKNKNKKKRENKRGGKKKIYYLKKSAAHQIAISLDCIIDTNRRDDGPKIINCSFPFIQRQQNNYLLYNKNLYNFSITKKLIYKR